MTSILRRLALTGAVLPVLLGLGAIPGSALPLPAPESTQVVVPDVIGQLEDGAKASLLAAGLIVGSVTRVSDPTCEFIGRVLRQDPPAGTVVDVGAAVKLTFGLKPRTICP